MSESSVKEASEEVAQLRDMFRLTGQLYSVQVDNLKIWPLLAFPMCQTASASLNLDEKSITFDLQLARGKKLPDNVKARGLGLLQSVQYLLGQDFEIRIVHKTKAIFHGKRLEPVKTYEGTDYEAGRIVPTTPWKPRKT